MKNTNISRNNALARAAALCVAGAAALGVFVWFKLRLVTNVPRSAYADPKQAADVAPPADPAPNAGTATAPAPKAPESGGAPGAGGR